MSIPNLPPAQSASDQPLQRVRVWDTPTRVFHWGLAAGVIALVVTAKVGGNAMNWHFWLGYAVATLLLFRLVWGFIGGHWSRFHVFAPTPGRLQRHLQGKTGGAAGHNPMGALSVFAMLFVLLAQVATGLLTDDEIAFAGPLTARVSNAVVTAATTWHKSWGQYTLLALVALHVAAIAAYRLKGKNLVRPMLTGDQWLPAGVALPSAKDGGKQWLMALTVLALAGVAIVLLVRWGGAGI